MKRLAFVALFASLTACAPDGPATSQTSAQTETVSATIAFDADWNERVDGALVAGGTLTVDYRPERLALCEGVQGGMLQWAITGYRQLDGGEVHSFDVISPNRPEGGAVTFALDAPGTLSLWFEATNRWGCHEWDSDFGHNYRYAVGAPDTFPSWAGNASFVISRYTCNGAEPCASDFRPLTDGFVFDTWARQRATISNAYFEAWEAGVTDWDNPELWRALDVQLHYRFDAAEPFSWRYVDQAGRSGHNARYAVPIRKLDPLGGNTITDPADCPAVPLEVAGGYVRTTMEYYFTVNDVEVRPAPGESYQGVFEDYLDLYTPCLPE